MGLVQNIIPFGLWKRIIPNDAEKLSKGGLQEELPQMKIDFVGPFNEKKLVHAILEYMGGRRFFFSEFITFAKGPEHNHVMSGFKRVSEEYKTYAFVRVRVHGWEPSGLKDKPDKGFVRVWINAGEQKWFIKKDYQGRFQETAKARGIYNFFSKYFLRRDYDDRVVPEFLSDMYGCMAVAKKELGIETIAYDEGMKKARLWH